VAVKSPEVTKPGKHPGKKVGHHKKHHHHKPPPHRAHHHDQVIDKAQRGGHRSGHRLRRHPRAG
jgi:hypothetical protein